MDTILAAIWIFTGGLALRGWLLATCWSWFVAQPFGIMPLGIWHAIGLSMTIELLAGVDAKSDKKLEGLWCNSIFITVLAKSCINAFVVWLLATIVRGCMV